MDSNSPEGWLRSEEYLVMGREGEGDTPDAPDAGTGLPPLDEVALRRPGWSSYRTGLLSDGQWWSFPRIGPVEAALIPDLCEMTDRFPEEGPGIVGTEEFWAWQARAGAALTPIAAKLLMLNYAITFDVAAQLFDWWFFREDDLDQSILDILNDGQPYWWPMDPDHHEGLIFAN